MLEPVGVSPCRTLRSGLGQMWEKKFLQAKRGRSRRAFGQIIAELNHYKSAIWQKLSWPNACTNPIASPLDRPVGVS